MLLTENDLKILARACDLCWHELDLPELNYSGSTSPATCKKCGKYFGHIDKWDWRNNPDLYNPTFSTPDDWEMVRVKVCNDPAFVPYVWNHMQDQYGTIHDAFAYWMTLSPEQCCQAVCNWIKSRPDLFPWVVDMEKGEGE